MKPPIVPALLILASLSAPALAHPVAPGDATPAAQLTVDAVPADTSLSVAPPARKSPMLNDAELDTQRGGQSIVLTNQTMESLVSGNVLNGDYTAGSVALSDFALSNFNGVGNLLINTGAQVSAQSGMNLTINLGD